MAIKQFTGNIGDLVEFTGPNDRAYKKTVVGYVLNSAPTKVTLTNFLTVDKDSMIKERHFWDKYLHEKTYSIDLLSWDGYNILKPYLVK